MQHSINRLFIIKNWMFNFVIYCLVGVECRKSDIKISNVVTPSTETSKRCRWLQFMLCLESNEDNLLEIYGKNKRNCLMHILIESNVGDVKMTSLISHRMNIMRILRYKIFQRKLKINIIPIKNGNVEYTLVEVSFYISTTWWVSLLVDQRVPEGTCSQVLRSTSVDS